MTPTNVVCFNCFKSRPNPCEDCQLTELLLWLIEESLPAVGKEAEHGPA